jgi:protein-tyrosine kinase
VSKMAEALDLAKRLRKSGKASSAPAGNVLKPAEDTSRLPESQTTELIINPAKVDRHIVCITDVDSPGAEQYRKLRAQILSSLRQTSKSTFMVTSADIGEGKSVTAVNLAIALAREIDHTVLLVDADLRKPSIHTYLGIRADRGLSEYLEGKVELSDVLIRTGIGKLVLLPAGTPPANPAELLASNRMKELAQEMKNRYADRYIIYDSSPILACADTVSLSRHVEAILLVIQGARTSEKTAKEALAILPGKPMLGVVYNNVPDFMCDNHPYDYYRYRQGIESAHSDNNNGKKIKH